MKIVLLGANGRTGREILNQALLSGHSVQALVRSADRLRDVVHDNLNVHVGDVRDSDVIRSLLPGQDVVISTLGPRMPTKSACAIYSQSGEAIVKAMKDSDVKRLLVTSSALHFPADSLLHHILVKLVSNIVQHSGAMEENIRTSELDWTIARTSFLTNAAYETYRCATSSLPEGGGSISRKALAHFLLDEALYHNHVRQVVGVSG